jgi:hypothetical protein
MPAVVGYGDAELPAEVVGQRLGMSVEDALAEQSTDAVPRPAAVLREVALPQVQLAESFPGHVALSSTLSEHHDGRGSPF